MMGFVDFGRRFEMPSINCTRITGQGKFTRNDRRSS